jgi:hypothetical protein
MNVFHSYCQGLNSSSVGVHENNFGWYTLVCERKNLKTLDDFLSSVENDAPPDSLSELLESLWFDRKGDWGKAHQIVQEIPTTEGSWVHAYLHREEGDLWNARYWYSRAGRREPKSDLDTEWREIVSTLIEG